MTMNNKYTLQGFHEAIGYVLNMAMVPEYYEQMGLLSPGEVDTQDEETNINLLLVIGLRRIVLLPWAYLVDRFRWDLYSGKASKAKS